MYDHNVPSYMDTCWDTMPHTDREHLSLDSAKQAAVHAKRWVPFYQSHYQHLSERDIENIDSLEDFAVTLPEVTKDHLSHNDYRTFLPQCPDTREREQYSGEYRNKSTGGTTGNPVSIIYSSEDWRAMAQSIARPIMFDFRDKPKELEEMLVFGLYHGDHVTNSIYQSGLALLGANFLSRTSTRAQDVDSNYEMITKSQPNAILAPPEDKGGKQTKGITLDKILQLDAVNSGFRLNRKVNPDFKAIFWSSMPMSLDLYDYLKHHLGIPYIQGQYGSTEICPTGSTCEHHPDGFHLNYGPSLVLSHAIGQQRLANDGEEGYLLVSKVGATRQNGHNTTPSGTQLINFRTGDYATLIHTHGEHCDCGRNTPIIAKLARREHVALKAKFGCQVD